MQLPWWLLGLWTIYSLLVVILPNYAARLYNYYVFVSIPNVFVTLGILGTFTGIVYGLQEFDVSTVESSLSGMITGLKSAFYTSIYGIILSIGFRKPVAWRVAAGVVKEPRTEQDETLAVMARTLYEIRGLMMTQEQGQKETREEQHKAHLQLVKVIAQNAINTQMRIDAVAERLAAANSEALVSALQDVITDFNRTFQMFIGELVEKNFDKLTTAVDQLIEWQEQNRDDVLVIRASYQEMLDKFDELVRHGESWVQTMDSVAGSGSALQRVVEEFNIAFQDNSKFRDTLERIHAATEELKQGAMHLKDLGQRFDGAARAFDRTQEDVVKWSTSAEKVAGMVADLQGTMVQLRSFDIAQIPKLEESFMKRMQQTMQSFDDLIVHYINYLEKRR